MKIKCAVLDFDGTLFDSMSIWETLGETYLLSLGKKPKPTVREDVRAMSTYQSACYFRDEYGIDKAPDEIIDGFNRIIEDFYINVVQPKPGAGKFLTELKDAEIGMCIATATDRRLIEAALKRCGLDGFFDKIFTCADVGHGKDEPFIFRRAMEHFHADRGSTLVFEDAFHAVMTSKKDGFITVSVYDGSEKRQEEILKISDFHIADFEHTDKFWEFASAL